MNRRKLYWDIYELIKAEMKDDFKFLNTGLISNNSGQSITNYLQKINC